jgi:hypothetical protein
LIEYGKDVEHRDVPVQWKSYDFESLYSSSNPLKRENVRNRRWCLHAPTLATVTTQIRVAEPIRHDRPRGTRDDECHDRISDENVFRWYTAATVRHEYVVDVNMARGAPGRTHHRRIDRPSQSRSPRRGPTPRARRRSQPRPHRLRVPSGRRACLFACSCFSQYGASTTVLAVVLRTRRSDLLDAF